MIRNFVRFFVLSAITALFAGAAAIPALAEIRVDIRRGDVEPLPIAVTEFSGITAPEASMGRDISSVVSGD
ncbi:MAG: Tol-Pal system protein TolB, partial [Proteobacteria bacterium]|nr:Tol-Pal system protein TolB [Pseudomonadota bacterium]